MTGWLFHTLSKSYDVTVGFVTPFPLRLFIALFAVAEGWLLLDMGWFVLFLDSCSSLVVLSYYVFKTKVIYMYLFVFAKLQAKLYSKENIPRLLFVFLFVVKSAIFSKTLKDFAAFRQVNGDINDMNDVLNDMICLN